MREPEEDEGEDDERGGEESEDGGEQCGEEGVILPGVAVGLAEVAGEEAVVAAIGFVGDVEDVADERDGADEDIEAEIDHHAGQGDVRDAADPGREDEDEGGDAGEHVADAGDESDEAVESEADGGAGDAEDVVEEMGEIVEILVGEEALGSGADAGAQGRENLGLGAVGHGCGCVDGMRWSAVGRGQALENGCGANATIRTVVADIVQRQNA